MRIVIIRHGQTNSNVINDSKEFFCTGALNNELTDLTEEGKDCAKKLSNNLIVQQIETVYCSDLNRTVETAKLAKPNFKLNLDARLRERTLGAFEGVHMEDLLHSKEYSKYILDKNFNKFRIDFNQKAPGGENYTDVYNRCKEFLNELDLKQNSTIGIFSHYHCIRCLFLNLLPIIPKESIFKFKIQNCETYVIECTKLGEGKLISHNIEDLLKK